MVIGVLAVAVIFIVLLALAVAIHASRLDACELRLQQLEERTTQVLPTLSGGGGQIRVDPKLLEALELATGIRPYNQQRQPG